MDTSNLSSDDLKAEFSKRFNNEIPDGFAVAPGRVNLIGEHIDYEGYSVLPMAIERNIKMVFQIVHNKTTISMKNNNDQEFKDFEIENDPSVNIDLSNINWASYFQCGFIGAWRDEHQTLKGKLPFGLNILVFGDIPLASGLSSSSAMVVASTMVCKHAAVWYMERYPQNCGDQFKYAIKDVDNMNAIADLCRKAEKHIGTMSGGMDQAASCLSQQGCAQVIHFDPLHTELVSLPEKAVFVIADSLTKSEKAHTAHIHYNFRVVECMLATKVLGSILQVENAIKLRTLKELQVHCNEKSLHDMIELVKLHLHETPYTAHEIAELCTVEDLKSVFIHEDVMQTSIQNVLEHAKEYRLYQRAMHVYSEASRVFSFQKICSASNDIHQLGQLMNESHASCDQLYDCSSIELNQLVATCIQYGAIGSRLTGAGWGGSTVSLVLQENVQSFVDQLSNSYYTEKTNHRIFACKPSSGASIYKYPTSKSLLNTTALPPQT